MEINEKIQKEIDKIKPYIINDGGNIEFIKFEKGVVYIKMSGACANCSMMDYTIKEGIEAILVNEIPEINAVVQISE